MRLGLPIMTTLTLLGCSGEGGPPTRPTTMELGVSAMVVPEDSAECIVGATVQVVAGQAVGESRIQDQPCDVWDPGGVSFTHLQPRVALTLRASAPGYLPQEKIAHPAAGGAPLIIVLTRAST
jgi:hypothetical protein